MTSTDALAARRAALRRLLELAFFAAMMYVAQVALAPLPNIELVSLFVALATRRYGARALFPVYAFVALQGATYGFGLWFVNYLYVWAALWALSMALRRMESALGWALALGGFGLFFGALCAVPYLFITGPAGALAYWVSGIPFDLMHAAGNAACGLLLMNPLHRALQRL